jgi:hypothetical protein
MTGHVRSGLTDDEAQRFVDLMALAHLDKAHDR